MLTTPLSQFIVSTYSGVILGAFGRHEMTPAAYIRSRTVTAVGFGLGFHRQGYVGYARVRHGPLGSSRASFGRHEITPDTSLPFPLGHTGYPSARVSSSRDISSSRSSRTSLGRHGLGFHRHGPQCIGDPICTSLGFT